MSKGISEIASAALYIGVSIVAVTSALTVGMPAIENMRDAAAIRKAQNFMRDMDTNIRQIVSEGKGSTRTLTLSLDRGRLYYENSSDALVYEIQTDSNVISPQSSRRTGNVVLTSNAEVDVYNVTAGGSNAPAGYNGPDCYMMENQHLRACIKQVANASMPQDINTTKLLTYYNFKEQDTNTNTTLKANMTVELNGIYNTTHGTGYTEVESFGDFVGTGQVKAHVSSEYGIGYDILFKLPTGADFMKVDVQNFN